MKKKLTAMLLIAALAASMLLGCAEKQPATPSQQPTGTPEATQQSTAKPAGNTPSVSPEPSMVPNPEVEKVYQEAMQALDEVMDRNCDVVYNGISYEMDYPYVSSGVMELSSMPRSELLQYLGYAYEDFNEDGIPELIIGTIPDAKAEQPEVQFLLGGYAYRDGETVCFLEGFARSVYEWMGGNRFFHYGSGGWAYSGFGTFRLSEDATELTAEEWYFSDTKGADNSEVAYFYNTTGVWDKDAAEELNIESDAFWELSNQYDPEIKTLQLTPFAKYEYTGFVAQPLDCKVRVDFFDDVNYQNDYDDATEYMDKGTDYETRILFRSEEGVKDFKLLSLSLKDVDANGHATFDVTEVFNTPALRAGTPLAAPMSFPGDIPSNGFSYMDTDGTTKAYTINISGRDGSLVVAPLD